MKPLLYCWAKAYLSTPGPHILKCKLKCIYEKKHFVSSKVSLSSGIKIFPFYCNFLLPSSSGTFVRETVFVTSDSQCAQFVLLSRDCCSRCCTSFSCLFIYFIILSHLNLNTYTKFRCMKQRSPWKPIRLMKRATFKNIWLNYEIKYWHQQDNLTKNIQFLYNIENSHK